MSNASLAENIEILTFIVLSPRSSRNNASPMSMGARDMTPGCETANVILTATESRHHDGECMGAVGGPDFGVHGGRPYLRVTDRRSAEAAVSMPIALIALR